MKKEVVIIFLLLFSISVFAQEQTQTEQTQTEPLKVEAGVLPDSPVYFFDKVVDDIKLNFAGEENKAEVAQQIHDERIAETKALVDKGNQDVGDFNEALEDAQEKNDIVAKEVTPESSEQISESSRRSVEVLSEIKDNVPEKASQAIETAINRQIVREKKTEIASEITRKIDELCSELIELVGLEAALQEEPRCNPDVGKSPKWLKRKVRVDYKDFDENARKKFVEEMKRCFDDPRQCRCEEIPIKSFSNKCFKMIPLVIKCEIENDENACARLGEEGQPEDAMFEELPQDVREKLEEMFREKESEGFKKHAPRECKDASATTRQECEKIMIAKYMPLECKEAGATTREACEKIMISKYAPPQCIKNGIFIGREQCETTMRQQGEFGGAPQECIRDGKFIGREACEKIMRSRFEQRREPDFNTEEAMRTCISQGKSQEECEAFIRSKFSQEQNLQRPPQPQSIGEVRQGEFELEKFEIKEVDQIPQAIVFKDGEAQVISSGEIGEMVEKYNSHQEDINSEDLRERFYSDISSLESGSSALDASSTDQAAAAIETSVSSQEQNPQTQESSQPPSAPSDSGGSGGGEGVTGSAILDFVRFL